MRCSIALPLALFIGCTPAPASDDDDGSTVAASEEPLMVDAGDLELEGTLLLPERLEGATVPGVVFVHGSGAHSRDSPVDRQLLLPFGFEIMLFADLAVALQEAGYAVYRYDKRSCGSWGACDNDYPLPGADTSIDDFVNDAVAAVDALGAHAAVDAVAVVGHSQGGGMAPRLVEEGADGGVSLAGPWAPVDELLVFQEESSRAMLEELGWLPAQIDGALGDLAQANAALGRLRDGTWDGSPIMNGSQAFWQSWMDLGDARPALAEAHAARLVALNGTQDWNVPVGELQGWSSVGVATTEIPCATHAMNCLSESDLASITADDIGREVDPAAVEALLEALAEVLP